MAAMAGRRIGKLTARGVAAAKKPGLTGDGGGLYLKVGDFGAKSWVFRHQVDGKVRTYGLGPLITVDLIDARQRAEAMRRQLLDGIDPRAAHRAAAVAAAKSISFDDAAEAYIKSHKAAWKSGKHGKQWAATLTKYVSPVFGKLPVSAIDTALVMRALQPIWTAKPETAGRVRGRIEAILAWATASEYRDGPNPALWRNHLKHLLPSHSKVHKIEHHAALPYVELPEFLDDLRQRDGVAARLLEFTILCAARTGETLNATWSEFDLDNRLWSIPGLRMKGGRSHRVPLSDRAVAIVRVMQTVKCSDYVFPGRKRGRPFSNMAMLTTLCRMGRDDLTAHGFRSTFRDWAAEETNFQNHVIEMALAHIISDKVEAAYRRGDLFEKRRRLMDAWSAFCDSATATGNVVALR
jgi:integrase